MSSVDVIVPCYKYGHYLEGCVDSVLVQRGVDLRVLILDDASPDQTAEVGAMLARRDARVEFRRHAVNQGHLATYNEGLDWARADYFLILSADDLLTPGSLARVTRVMDAHPEVTLAFGRDVPFEGTSVPTIHVSDDESCGSKIISYEDFLDESCRLGFTPIMSPTAVVRLAVQKRVGGFRPDQPHSGDTEGWLRVASQGAVGWVDAIQAFRRIHGANMSFDYQPLRRLQEHQKAFDTHFAEFGNLLADVGRFRRQIYGTLADQAFWIGAKAFDAGDTETCRKCLDYARSIQPSIESSTSWTRLRWKQRLGPGMWTALRPVADLLRGRRGPALGSPLAGR